MRLLLDTHALIWSLSRSAKFPPRVTEALTDPENQILISAVSIYEIEYKRPFDPELQRLPIDLEEVIEPAGYDWLAVTWRHARAAAKLPHHHRDPWDRLLIAQSLLENAILVTLDTRIMAYGVPVLW